MPRSLEERDYHAHALVYALIHERVRGWNEVDPADLHKMMPRYVRELEMRRVRVPDMYPDIFSGRYEEIEEAIIQAVSYDWIGLKMRDSRVRIHTDFRRLLERPGSEIHPDELQNVREAARVAVEKFHQGKLDDDKELSNRPAPTS